MEASTRAISAEGRVRSMEDRYLYRAKRTDNGEWVEGALFDGKESCIIGQNIKFSPYVTLECKIVGFEVDRETICQCTGLNDKNGKLIWENDVVRYTDMITCVEKIDRIEWNETHASFVRLHRSQMGLQYISIDEFIANGCEVIGSAIDNPELLEVGE